MAYNPRFLPMIHHFGICTHPGRRSRSAGRTPSAFAVCLSSSPRKTLGIFSQSSMVKTRSFSLLRETVLETSFIRLRDGSQTQDEMQRRTNISSKPDRIIDTTRYVLFYGAVADSVRLSSLLSFRPPPDRPSLAPSLLRSMLASPAWLSTRCSSAPPGLAT